MKPIKNVAILGVGLIGGSIGKAVLRADAATGAKTTVIGIGRDQSRLDLAKKSGCVTQVTTDLIAGVAEAQLVIVCTPVDKIVEHVRQIAAVCGSNALITDAGSTKQQIVQQLADQSPTIRFVGSHPLAGGEKTGAEHATADLFEQKVVVLTPTDKTATEEVECLTSFWSSLGAKVVCMSPQQHDRALANTSHLPRLVAGALAHCTPQDDLPLTSTGWQDTTRTAAGNVAMWQAIFQANRSNVLQALLRFEKTIQDLREALAKEDDTELEKLLTEAKQKRDAMGS